jgi:hypothetical protein
MIESFSLVCTNGHNKCASLPLRVKYRYRGLRGASFSARQTPATSAACGNCVPLVVAHSKAKAEKKAMFNYSTKTRDEPHILLGCALCATHYSMMKTCT